MSIQIAELAADVPSAMLAPSRRLTFEQVLSPRSPASALKAEVFADTVPSIDAVGHDDLERYVERPIHMELYGCAVARSSEFLVLDYKLETARLQKRG